MFYRRHYVSRLKNVSCPVSLCLSLKSLPDPWGLHYGGRVLLLYVCSGQYCSELHMAPGSLKARGSSCAATLEEWLQYLLQYSLPTSLTITQCWMLNVVMSPCDWWSVCGHLDHLNTVALSPRWPVASCASLERALWHGTGCQEGRGEKGEPETRHTGYSF